MVRYALIGYGKVSHVHAKALGEAKDSKLVAVWGRDAQKAEQFAKVWNIQAFTDMKRMIAEAQVDAVIITTPHPLHKQHAIEALKGGAHVLVEKPMALTVADCQAMVDCARQEKKKLAVVSQRRWFPATKRIHQAIADGKIGKAMIGQVTMLGWRDKEYYNSDPWRGKWDKEGGGVLINQAPHQLDLLHWFLGPVKEVYAQWDNVNHPYIEVEDTVVGTVRFTSGAIASILVSNSQKPGIYAKVHVHGSNGFSTGVQTDGGAMFIAGRSGITEPPYNDLWTVEGEQQMLETWKQEDTAFFKTIDAVSYFFRLQHEDFTQAIINDTTPTSSGEEGMETVKLIEGMYISGRTGKAVRY
ncbi:Gfo/Idh/MocA family oxidoreductase [Sphaerochaeta sp. PS]|uniref:Gfo/Idh/MocA family protein n=1 Tax=Sphaerochaeta sp. PS TaxID=3076336 RepID=UPI0028A53B86|nr:Gfo/Idh/MocA family oxidoreductase [Sphaerochaeta sp. PS]MDT4763039.1 Gfo/Idh/MocA family oxidoreductase [Sphaerochaeta sp. PS]